MAQARRERERKYAENGTYGSLAYDLYSFGDIVAMPNDLPNEAVNEVTLQEAADRAREKRRQAARERAGARDKAIESARQAQAVSIAGVVGFAIIAVLMIFVVLSYVRLHEISTELTVLNAEITELETAETRLRIQYEEVFNLNTVRDYATDVLGMTRLTEANTYIVPMERADKAEVLAKDDSGFGIIGAIQEFISSLTEYLR